MALALVGILTTGASATVLFSDDFSAVGSGTGFSDNWSAGTISGGEIAVASTTSYRTLTSSITTNTADFWLDAKLEMSNKTGSTWAGLSFFNGGTEDMFFGADSASSAWEFDTRGMGDQTSTVSVVNDAMTHIVAHITSTSIDMWIDPSDISSIAALGTADKSFTVNPVTDQAQWTRLRIGAGGQTITSESVTAATTFGEAVPEPATMSLLALGGMAMLRRRKRS